MGVVIIRPSAKRSAKTVTMRASVRSLPTTEASGRSPTAANTLRPPKSHCVRSPVDRIRTGTIAGSTSRRKRPIHA